MTPRTRTSNKDASYKVYYSKKVPQQIRFPYKRKAVRRPEPTEQDADQKRQLRFLPEIMRQQEVHDEDHETEVRPSAHCGADGEPPKSTNMKKRAGMKRNDRDPQDDMVTLGISASASSKRRRRTTMPKEEPGRMLRRQSTMTQLADGRRPSMCAIDPEFKPAKRPSRVSWGGTSGTEKHSERDKKQRTLTQMIPGIGRLSKEELEELSDLDADLEDDDTSGNAISQTLFEQGLFQVDVPARTTAPAQGSGCIVQREDATFKDHEEHPYQPTQYIEAPTFRSGRTPRRAVVHRPSGVKCEPTRSTKSRFSLLSTPEKRRVFEIPSSQSPPESILSTQTSPQKSNKSVLRERTNNTTLVAETPSKCRQVDFRRSPIQPPPACLRIFESTIQDSEDEEGSDIENDAAEDQDHIVCQQVHVQAGSVAMQSTPHRTGRACADEHKDVFPDGQGLSEEIEQVIVRRGSCQPSTELGDSWAPVIYDDDGHGFDSYQSSRSGIKTQSLRGTAASQHTSPIGQAGHVSQLDLTESTHAPVLIDDLPSTPPPIQPRLDQDMPSTPMVIKDESSDDEAPISELDQPRIVLRETPEPPSTLFQQSTDLDGEPVQVERFPSADRETQQSHSSKAEQQLHNEWLSYSQYIHARAPNSSSIHAAVGNSTYNSTPRPSRNRASAPSSTRIQHSQATTVDEVTPKKDRTQQVISAITTPHRFSKSQPFISPEKPPSLFIPSSFPSPSRTAMEGWSSPVATRTQNVYGSSQAIESLENFSIPPPPPTEYD